MAGEFSETTEKVILKLLPDPLDRFSNKIQVELEQYKKNLIKIIEISKIMTNKMIWIGLTPVIDEVHNAGGVGFLRYSKDVNTYDVAAKSTTCIRLNCSPKHIYVFLFAYISQMPFNYFGSGNIFAIRGFNVLFTLLLGLISIFLYLSLYFGNICITDIV